MLNDEQHNTSVNFKGMIKLLQKPYSSGAFFVANHFNVPFLSNL